MASYEGPVPSNQDSAPADINNGPASATLAELPALTPERLKKELETLANIITSTEKLNFLEPRVQRCIDSGESDLLALLSFYRLVSGSLAEEISEQKESLRTSQSALVQAKQSSAQAQMLAALEEASQAVQLVSSRGEGSTSASSTPSQTSIADEASSQKLEQAEKQIERLMIDMQNIRNRAKTDVDIRVFKELEKFSLSLLPALDAFHQAMASMSKATEVQSVVTGVHMIYDQLLESLDKAGLQRLKTVGEKFDPRVHEAIGTIESTEVADDHVFDELQPGYSLGERLIRAAMVRIARNPSPPAAQATPEIQPVPQAQAEAPPQAQPAARVQTAPQQDQPAAQAQVAPQQAQSPT